MKRFLFIISTSVFLCLAVSSCRLPPAAHITYKGFDFDSINDGYYYYSLSFSSDIDLDEISIKREKRSLVWPSFLLDIDWDSVILQRRDRYRVIGSLLNEKNDSVEYILGSSKYYLYGSGVRKIMDKSYAIDVSFDAKDNDSQIDLNGLDLLDILSGRDSINVWLIDPGFIPIRNWISEPFKIPVNDMIEAVKTKSDFLERETKTQ